MKTEIIMKKILVWIILVSFINLTGCYSHELFAPTAYKFNEKKEIKVITKDTTYNFKGYQYILVDDTLIATKGNLLLNKSLINNPSVKIPVEEMNLVEVKKVEAAQTTLVVIGVTIVAIVVIGVISLATTDWRLHL